MARKFAANRETIYRQSPAHKYYGEKKSTNTQFVWSITMISFSRLHFFGEVSVLSYQKVVPGRTLLPEVEHLIKLQKITLAPHTKI